MALDVKSNLFACYGSGAKILERLDYKLGFEEGIVRVHIPVQTNSQVESCLDGELLPWREGEAWYLNFNLPHSVINGSARNVFT